MPATTRCEHKAGLGKAGQAKMGQAPLVFIPRLSPPGPRLGDRRLGPARRPARTLLVNPVTDISRARTMAVRPLANITPEQLAAEGPGLSLAGPPGLIGRTPSPWLALTNGCNQQRVPARQLRFASPGRMTTAWRADSGTFGDFATLTG